MLPGDTHVSVSHNIHVPTPSPFKVTINGESMTVTGVSGPHNTQWAVQRGAQPVQADAGTRVEPTAASQDREFLDFSPTGAMSVYTWELYFHIPLYIAKALSQNQKFEDAHKWFLHIFNPTCHARAASGSPSP